MTRRITRRDFLDGVALGLSATATGFASNLMAQTPSAGYPPALTGMRGSHPGAFEPFHLLRDGRFWPNAPHPENTAEEYDLVVVGAGISGLAAAHYYRKAHPGAKILLLDNHDDFGGHAKRNEFSHDGKTYLSYGGTFAIESPAPYSPTAKALLRELGIDVSRYPTMVDRNFTKAHGLHPAFFFDQERFGADKLVLGSRRSLDQALLADAPISEAARTDLKRLWTEHFDPYPGDGSAAKKAKLAKMSYADFLTSVWKVDPGLLPIFQTAPHSLFGAGIDAVPAQDAFGLGLPGFQGMQLDPGPGPGQNYDSIRSDEAEAFFMHFPDGNATIARALVRKLVPAAIAGRTIDDLVTTRADYGRLDSPGAAVRIRLSSLVMRVRHLGDPGTAKSVEVAYLTGDRLKTVVGRRVILACWHAPIPYLCPELPAAQKEALAFAIKIPLVYTSVLIRNWTALVKLGVNRVESPGFWHTNVGLNLPVSVGKHHYPTNPAEPILLHLEKSACKPGLPIRDQHRIGRNELYATPFETIERGLRHQLGRIFGPGGFDPAADILGITVNRWPHGYAYQYNSLWDDFWFEGKETPCQVARRPYGRIAIANADAGAYSYTDGAIDQGARAVKDLGPA